MSLSSSIRLKNTDASSSMLFNANSLADLLGTTKRTPGMKSNNKTKRKKASSSSVNSTPRNGNNATADDLIKEILMQNILHTLNTSYNI